ncbi:glycosyl hydrolase 53 family protein [uncultured Pseudokineococcus sp.]|uniref:glycosyl hydrolase 53 family protein n=1 Tax=uncultured Pseudokineococcus sp. TaxID=1642928 RepID=UPI002639C2C9|nr:glycosyl hydrolase 53 family protein [uncultured Pseudokineococcus sp.]
MGRATRRAGLSAGAAITVGGLVLATAAPSAALHGEAVIEPIESDIAEKPWATASDAWGSTSATLAVDGDESTAWTARTPRPGEALTVDLGGAYDNLRKVEVVLADAAADQRYVVEASGDGRSWDVVGDHRDGRSGAAGSTDLLVRPGTRYVRVRSTAAAPRPRFGVAEISVQNYLRDDLVLGADLSYADQERDRWYFVDAEAALAGEPDAGPRLLDVAADRGMEYVRLRVWNDPRSEATGVETDPAYQSPERTLRVAREVTDRGMGLGIDLHYADSWADPAKQPKPRAWAELPFDQLEQAVYDYTADHLRQLAAQGTVPDKVGVGNEVINGFMYGSEAQVIGTTAPAYFVDEADVYQSQPGGGLLWDYWGSEDPEEQRAYDQAWDRFTTLMAAGIRAVRDASPDSQVEIHTIVDQDRLDKTMEFWTQTLTRLNAKGVDPDVLATSYYPQWHGGPEDLDRNLHAFAQAFPGYELEVAETSYPASSWPPGDTSPLPNSPFPRTVQGQADALQRVIQAANDVVDNRGQGMLVWEPASWESMFTWVEVDGGWYPEANASLDVYTKSAAQHVLQDRVFAVADVGGDVDLPGAVEVLHSVDDSRERVPVEWAASPGTARAGTSTVEGSTRYGPVTATVHVVEKHRTRP